MVAELRSGCSTVSLSHIVHLLQADVKENFI